MARLLVEAASLLYSTHSGGLYTNVFVGIGGLLMSLCGALLILSMCSLCYTRKLVGDKASSSDGDDVSPAKQDAASSKKNSAYSLNTVSEEGKEHLQGSTTEQEQGKSPPVWQRAILMGERCQRPTFSGLVLYDEKGNPLPIRCLSALQQAKM